jgi:hypothetical protein
MTDHTVQDPGKLARSGQTIADQSAVLGQELGLRDLVLTQVLFVVGLGWIGTAAKVGPSHIVFWLPAITRLRPDRRTPVNSILFVGAVTLAVGVASVAGVGEQEAYQRSASAP